MVGFVVLLGSSSGRSSLLVGVGSMITGMVAEDF